ncbi:MAG: hypothetical protein RLP15_07815 [Cryomorphaceae bacterium]
MIRTLPVLALSVVFGLSACKKLDEPVDAHFFVQNAKEDYTLYINDVRVGVINSTTEIPVICDDSLMMLTTPYVIELKKNSYRLEDESSKVVASGSIRLGKQSVSTSGEQDFGGTYVWIRGSEMIMGFNSETITPELINRCEP